MTQLFNLVLLVLAGLYIYDKITAGKQAPQEPREIDDDEAVAEMISESKRIKARSRKLSQRHMTQHKQKPVQEVRATPQVGPQTPSASAPVFSNEKQLLDGLLIDEIVTKVGVPSEDGEASVEVSLNVNNNSDSTLKRLIVRGWLEDAQGMILGGDSSEEEVQIAAGDSETVTFGLGSVNHAFINEQVKTCVRIIGCVSFKAKTNSIKLGEPTIGSFKVSDSHEIGKGLILEKSSGLISEDSSGSATVKYHYLFRNTGPEYFPAVQVRTIITKTNGGEPEETTGGDLVLPFAHGLVSDYMYIEKVSKLRSGSIRLEILAFEAKVKGEGLGVGFIQEEPSEEDSYTDDEDTSDKLTEVATLRFSLTDLEGQLPSLQTLDASKRTVAYLKSCMEFRPEFDSLSDKIKNFAILEDGLDGLEIGEDGAIDGYPTPLIRVELSEPVSTETIRRSASTSSYKLEIPEVNKNKPVFFEDHNGDVEVIEADA